MEIKRIDDHVAERYLQHLFETDNFASEYDHIKLEHATRYGDQLTFNVRCYKNKYDVDFEVFAFYPTLDEFNTFNKTVRRKENIGKLLDEKTN